MTFPIGFLMAGMKGLESKRSISTYGLSQVTVIFKDGTDVYFTRQFVNERPQKIRSSLPLGIEPTMGPVSTGLGEICLYTVDAEPGARKPDGRPYTATDLRSVQDWTIRPQLLQVLGVSEVNSIGGYAKQYQVAPDPAKLLAYHLTLQNLIQALESNNLDVGAGYIERNGEQALVRIPGQLMDTRQIADVVIATRDGAPIKVGDVAQVQIDKNLRTGAATHDSKETVLGTAMLLLGENSRTVSQAVAQKLQEIEKQLPPGGRATPVYDCTTLVDKTIATVQKKPVRGCAAGDRGAVRVSRRPARGADHRGGDSAGLAGDFHRYGREPGQRQPDESGCAGLWSDCRRHSDYR